MIQLARCLLVLHLAVSLMGCHNPARQNVPRANFEELESQWRKELVPGRRADRAMAYLLTNRFDCLITRDDEGRVQSIRATPPNADRRSLGILIEIADDKIQSVDIRPRSFR